MFFKKWRHQRRKDEIKKTLDEGVQFLKEVIDKHELTAKIDKDFSLMYVSSENLAKHSKRLTCLTIALFVTSVSMIGLAIAQSVFLWRAIEVGLLR